jgi:hypothetical protein
MWLANVTLAVGVQKLIPPFHRALKVTKQEAAGGSIMRRSKNWTREQFDKMARGIGLPLLGLEAGCSVLEALLGLAAIDAARVLLILERGIKSDLYGFSPGAGIVQNNDQPFPIFGGSKRHGNSQDFRFDPR